MSRLEGLEGGQDENDKSPYHTLIAFTASSGPVNNDAGVCMGDWGTMLSCGGLVFIWKGVLID